MVKVGGWSSTNDTVTLKLAEPVFPLESRAVQLTVVDPTLNLVPDAGVQVAVIDPLTASVAVGTV